MENLVGSPALLSISRSRFWVVLAAYVFELWSSTFAHELGVSMELDMT